MRPVCSPKLQGVTWESLNSCTSFEELVGMNELLDSLEFAEALARKS